MLTMRPYQQRLLDEVRDAIREGYKSILIVLPTGGGKTVVASQIGRTMVERALRLWFVCHRDFLVDQTSKTFIKNELPHGFIAAGKPTKLQPVMCCMQPTLAARVESYPTSIRPKVIMWDEAHHMAAETWAKIMRWAGEDCIHIGLTATPERLDGRGLGRHFQKMILGPSTRELMEMGMLSQYRAFAPKPIDLAGVRTNAGEYVIADLEAAIIEQGINGSVVEEYRRRGKGRKGVYFCVSVAHSKALAASFEAAGVRALHIDGKTPTDARIAAAKAFARGELDVLTNCSIFGEGYDLAAQAEMDVTIDLVGLVRPTQSLSLHLQMLGRALRPKSYPALFLDHAGNLLKHGLPDQDRDWSLEGRVKKPKAPAMAKECPHCLAMNPIQAQVCIECEAPFETQSTRSGPKQVDNELIEIDRKAALEAKARKRRVSEGLQRAQSYDDVRKLGEEMGYKSGWAGIAWQGEKRRRENMTMMAEAQAAAYLRR